MEIIKVKHTDDFVYFKYKFEFLKTRYIETITTVRSPFGNCQNFSIIDFKDIVDNSNNDKEILEFVDRIFTNLMKNSVIIDVEEYYYKTIKRIFKDRIIVTKPYKSTNDSKMRLIIISRYAE